MSPTGVFDKRDQCCHVELHQRLAQVTKEQLKKEIEVTEKQRRSVLIEEIRFGDVVVKLINRHKTKYSDTTLEANVK